MSSKETCSVCHDDVDIYAIGQCDHPICFKCSTRMRVLCEQMYCAICRADMPKIIFMKDARKFETVDTGPFLVFKKHKIYFETEAIQSTFYELISHKCKFCQGLRPFRYYGQLETHMRREHELHYCDICVKHLKIFSWERKSYDRVHLARHRRLGDEDDKSFKGHPLCELCDQRFLDKDELARHCRKEHFLCHFCETDGRFMEFFGDYSLLRDHFSAEHYLCEEGDCYDARFTNAFRSSIDLKAHRATSHSKSMKKAEARQARTIEVDIQLAPRMSGSGRGRHYPRDRDSNRGHRSDEGDREDYRDRRPRYYARQKREEMETMQAVAASLNNIQKQSGTVAVLDPALLNPLAINVAQNEKRPDRKFEQSTSDFPTLDGKTVHGQAVDSDEDTAGRASAKRDPGESAKNTLAKKVARASNFSIQEDEMEEMDFPSLAGRGKGRHVQANGKPGAWQSATDSSDYPSLSSQKSTKQKTENGTVKGFVQPAVSSRPASATTSTWTQSKSYQAPNVFSAKPQSSRKPASNTPGSVPNISDFPSLSNISNSLLPSQAAPAPAPKLSMTRSSSAAAALGDMQKASREPPPPKPSAANFAKDDFPSFGAGPKTSAPSGKWASSNSPKMAPKNNSKPQTKKTQSNDQKQHEWQEVKVTKGAKNVTEEKKPQSPKVQRQPVKQAKSLHAAIEEKQGKDLENFVAQQTKSNKKKSKGKKSPNNQDVKGTDSDRESGKEESKTREVDKGNAETREVRKVDKVNAETKSHSKDARKVEPSKSKPLSKSASLKKSSDIPKAENKSESVQHVQSAVIEKQALQPRVDNFPSLSELSQSIPADTLQDFPVLGSSAKSKPPPGFGNKSKDVAEPVSRPPPGFSSSLASVSSQVKPPPGFKTIKGENIENEAPSLTNGSVKSFVYIQPANFKERNQQLIKDIQKALSLDQFDEFKSWSGEFRQAQINGSEYYNKCCDIIGVDAFGNIFPELLTLLPDIGKQKELLEAHSAAQEKSKDVTKTTREKRGWKVNFSQFNVCPTCSQVVLGSELNSHSSEHSVSSDFPSLGPSQRNTTAFMGTWGKK